MKIGTAIRRFLAPGWLVALHYRRRFGAVASPLAEVEISPLLELGLGTRIGPFTKVKATSGLVRVGAGTEIGAHCMIAGAETGIEIGRNCRIGPHVAIVGVNYRYERIDMTFRAQGTTSKGTTRIGDNVVIGAGAAILDGADIAAGAVIRPRAVVSGKVAARARKPGPA